MLKVVYLAALASPISLALGMAVTTACPQHRFWRHRSRSSGGVGGAQKPDLVRLSPHAQVSHQAVQSMTSASLPLCDDGHRKDQE